MRRRLRWSLGRIWVQLMVIFSQTPGTLRTYVPRSGSSFQPQEVGWVQEGSSPACPEHCGPLEPWLSLLFQEGLPPWAISVGDGCVLAPTPFSASSAQIVFPCFWSSFPDFSLTLLTLQE